MYRSHAFALTCAVLLGGCFDITEPDVFRCSDTFSQCPGDKECINGICQLRDAGKGEDKSLDRKKVDAKQAIDGKVDGPTLDAKLIDGPKIEDSALPDMGEDQALPDMGEDQALPDMGKDSTALDLPQGKLDGGTISLYTDRMAYWPFSEGSGQSSDEYAGGADDQISISTLNFWGMGTSGTGLDFNLADSAEIMDKQGKLDGKTNMTLSFWYAPARKLDKYTQSMVLLQKGTIASYYCGINIFTTLNSTAVLSCQVHASPHTNSSVLHAKFEAKANQWRLVTLVMDGTNGKLTLYLDGQQALPPVIFGSGVYDSKNTLDLGRGWGNSSGSAPLSASGHMDELMIWKRALSAAEAKTLYDTTKPAECVTPKVAKECTSGGYCAVPAGCFVMGSANSESCRSSTAHAENQRRVTLTRPFQVGQAEVLGDEIRKVFPTHPLKNTCPSVCPADRVTWEEAAYYCNELSTQKKLTSCYICSLTGAPMCQPKTAYTTGIQDCPGFRLPTGAEWEYAYRAGASTSTPAGDVTTCAGPDSKATSVAWYASNSGSKVNQVEQKAANLWGIHDMAGNIGEWCHTTVNLTTSYTPQTDPAEFISGVVHSVRGGDFLSTPRAVRAASRVGHLPGVKSDRLGFRCVRSLPDQLVTGSGTAHVNVKQMVVDAAGNRYLTGTFVGGKLTLGGLSVSTATSSSTDIDIFIAKLDKDGKGVWLHQLSSTAIERATALTLDGKGGLIVGGNFDKSLTFPTGPAKVLSGGGLFIALIDKAGKFVWATKVGNTSQAELLGVTVLSTTGQIFFTGNFQSSAIISGSALSAAGDRDIFLGRLKSDGAIHGAVKFGGSEYDTGKGIVATYSGEIYVTGYFKGTAKFSSKFSLTANSGSSGTINKSDMFLIVADVTMSPNWVISGGGDADDAGNVVTLDKQNNILVGGYFSGSSVKFGNTVLTHKGNGDGFIAKYNKNGTLQWVTNVSTTKDDQITGLAADPSGQFIVAGGWFGDSLTMGTRTITSVGSSDALLIRMDSNGNTDWLTSAGGTGADLSYGVGLDGLGRVHLGGSFEGTASFWGRKASTATGASGMKNAFIWMRTLP